MDLFLISSADAMEDSRRLERTRVLKLPFSMDE